MTFSTQKGFSVVEAIIATSIFALITTSMIGILIYVNNSAQFAGSKQRALLIAEEGLEAVRNIRDSGFDELDDGTTGIRSAGNLWSFFGADNNIEEFTRVIEISSVDSNTKEIVSTVSWEERGVDREVELSTYLTYWQEENLGGDALCLDVDISGVILNGNRRELRRVYVSNTCASDIIIDTVAVEWSNNRRINRVRFQPVNVWRSNGSVGSPSGTQTSGTELDILDRIITSADTFETRYRFNGNMSGQVFTITYKMDDGSTKIVTGISP